MLTPPVPRHHPSTKFNSLNVGALIVRIGLWGIIYYAYKGTPKTLFELLRPLNYAPRLLVAGLRSFAGGASDWGLHSETHYAPRLKEHLLSSTPIRHVRPKPLHPYNPKPEGTGREG